MNKFNIGGFKLPHMAPFNNNKIKNPKTAEEEKMAEAKKAFRRISQKPLLEPKPLHPNSGGSSLRNNGVVGSSGGLTPDERAKAIKLLDSTRDTYVNVGSKRVGKMVDGKVVFENIPVSQEEGLKNWEQEGKSNFYVDFDQDGNASVKSVPRGDDDIPVQSFLKSLDSSQYRGYIPKDSDLPKDYQDPGLTPGHPLNPFEGYQRAENYRNR